MNVGAASASRPKVSVLVPSLNQDRFLVKALATVAKQEYAPLEVIIGDGGSTDHTRRVVESYGPLVTRFISGPDRGQLDGLEKAIGAATGDIFYWMNADDALMPGALSFVADTFSSDPALEVIFSDSYAFDEERKSVFASNHVSNLGFWPHFLYYRQLPSEGVFWRASITQQVFPLDHSLRICTDYSFFLALRYGHRCRWVPRRLGLFRIQAAQASQRYRDRIEEERRSIRQRMCQRVGITQKQFERLQRLWRPWYALTQRVYPRVYVAARYLRRKLTGDRERRRIEQFLFGQWLRPPDDVLRRLGTELCEQWGLDCPRAADES